MSWDPVRPLTGPGDWLARIRWVDGIPNGELRRWLRRADGNGWTVAVPGTPQQRLALVERLIGALRDGNGEPALDALLQEERAQLARDIEAGSTRTHLRHALGTLKQSLYRYQQEGVEAFDRSGSFLSRIERIVAPASSPGPARAEEVTASEDLAVEREIESMVAAGDESRDASITAAATSEPSDSVAAIQHLVAGVRVQRTAGGGLIVEAPPEAASTLAALFSRMAQLLQAAAPPATSKGPGGRR